MLDDKGYWFVSESEQKDLDTNDYGHTIVSPAYVCNKIRQLQNNPLISRASESFWWGHQDLWIVKKGDKNKR